MIEIRWHGRGGQGSWTAARMFGMAAALYENRYALAFPSFGPERRGAPVLGFTKIDDKKIIDRSEVQESDYVVVLDETLIDEPIGRGIKGQGIVIINSREGEKYRDIFPDNRIVAINATDLAISFLKMPITNTAMMAALMAVSKLVGMEAGQSAIRKELKPAVAEKNVHLLEAAYDLTTEVLNG